MKSRSKAFADYDSPWKVALHKYLNWFLAFFFPGIHGDIDWPSGYESLDKEFQQIVRQAEVGKQFGDMLLKVWLRHGGECWLLIHVEIQGSYEKEFARRMFEYNTAIRKLYNREVVSLAVLCDDRPGWRPTTCGYGRWGSYTGITFPAVKLLDYADQLDVLETNPNPFAVVVLAHLKSQATRMDLEQRRAWKFRLVRGLYERNLSKEDIRELFRLIDWILDLPDSLQERFREDVYQYEEEKRMPYLSSLERMGFEKGRKEGREEGREEGLQTGRELVAVALEAKFGQAGRKLLARIRRINDVAQLRRLAKIIKTAATPDDVDRRLK